MLQSTVFIVLPFELFAKKMMIWLESHFLHLRQFKSLQLYFKTLPQLNNLIWKLSLMAIPAVPWQFHWLTVSALITVCSWYLKTASDCVLLLSVYTYCLIYDVISSHSYIPNLHMYVIDQLKVAHEHLQTCELFLLTSYSKKFCDFMELLFCRW